MTLRTRLSRWIYGSLAVVGTVAAVLYAISVASDFTALLGEVRPYLMPAAWLLTAATTHFPGRSYEDEICHQHRQLVRIVGGQQLPGMGLYQGRHLDEVPDRLDERPQRGTHRSGTTHSCI